MIEPELETPQQAALRKRREDQTIEFTRRIVEIVGDPEIASELEVARFPTVGVAYNIRLRINSPPTIEKIRGQVELWGYDVYIRQWNPRQGTVIEVR